MYGRVKILKRCWRVWKRWRNGRRMAGGCRRRCRYGSGMRRIPRPHRRHGCAAGGYGGSELGLQSSHGGAGQPQAGARISGCAHCTKCQGGTFAESVNSVAGLEDHALATLVSGVRSAAWMCDGALSSWFYWSPRARGVCLMQACTSTNPYWAVIDTAGRLTE